MTRSMKVAALAIVTVLALLLYPRPAPSSGPVIPSATLGAASTDQAQSGETNEPDVTNGRTSGPSAGARPLVVSPTPHPTGDIGQPASYCRRFCDTPEPRVVVSKGTGLSGQATWWNSFGSGIYAAIRPDLGSKGDLAIVCGGHPFHCISAPITTTCACLGPGSDRLIDLSRDAFESFADPSVGTVRIVLQVIEGGAP